MGDPKSRKRKVKTEDIENENIGGTNEEINDIEVRMTDKKTKKAKKNKMPEVHIEEVLENNESVEKPKKSKKNKLAEMSTEAPDQSEIKKEEVETKKAKKHKISEMSTEVSENVESSHKQKKTKKNKLKDSSTEAQDENKLDEVKTKKHFILKKKNKKLTSEVNGDQDPELASGKALSEEIIARYPLLADDALVERVMAVSLKTHQRTRMRQTFKLQFQDTPKSSLPDEIHKHLQSLLGPEISDNDLRKVRMLRNMLKTELGLGQEVERKSKVKKAKEESEHSIEMPSMDIPEEILARYPVLGDADLVKRFMAVQCSNNQKGRIRQALRATLKSTTDALLPDVIHTKLQAVLKKPELGDSDLRKIRMLYNMLKTSLQIEEPAKKKEGKEKRGEKKGTEKGGKDKDGKEQKVKGPKRYVVFVGNLPLDITKEKISEHFSDLSDRLKHVRVPKPAEGKKSAIAYIEVVDEVSYELALSKHHSMLDNRRITVLYSTQQNTKISKTEAKGKAAKLVAMQKAGKLAGSIALSKKRSARRNKMKAAQKRDQEAKERGV